MAGKLAKYIEMLKITDQTNDCYITVQDTSLSYCFASTTALNMLGVRSYTQIKGKKLDQLSINLTELSHDFRRLRETCIAQLRSVTALGLLAFANRAPNLYSIQIYPILDEKGNLYGIKEYIKSYPRVRPLLYNEFSSLCNLRQLEERLMLDLKITQLEYLIIFLLAYGFSIKQISYFVYKMGGSKSISTIRNIVHRQLLKKFNCNSSSDLIHKANLYDIVGDGFPSLFKNFQFVIEV